MSEVFPYRPPLPMGSIGLRSSGFWGMVFLVLSEASLFAYLFFSYFYFSVQPHPGPWPPSGPPDLSYAIAQTAIVLIACATMWWADRSVALEHFCIRWARIRHWRDSFGIQRARPGQGAGQRSAIVPLWCERPRCAVTLSAWRRTVRSD